MVKIEVPKSDPILQCPCTNDSSEDQEFYEITRSAYLAAFHTLQYNKPSICPRAVMRCMVDVLCMEMVSQEKFSNHDFIQAMQKSEKLKWVTDSKQVFDNIATIIEARYVEVRKMLEKAGEL